MTPRRPMRIPGAPPSVSSPDIALWNGACPICEARVLWATDRTDGADASMWHAPLDPTIVQPDPTPLVWVVESSTGNVSAVQPVLHARHVCPAEVVEEILRTMDSLGYYTAEILAVSCPVRACKSAPGMLCLSQRREALPRPHGARVVLSRGEELELPDF